MLLEHVIASAGEVRDNITNRVAAASKLGRATEYTAGASPTHRSSTIPQKEPKMGWFHIAASRGPV